MKYRVKVIREDWVIVTTDDETVSREQIGETAVAYIDDEFHEIDLEVEGSHGSTLVGSIELLTEAV